MCINIKKTEHNKLNVSNSRYMLFDIPNEESKVMMINITCSTMFAIPILLQPIYSDEFLLDSQTIVQNPLQR